MRLKAYIAKLIKEELSTASSKTEIRGTVIYTIKSKEQGVPVTIKVTEINPDSKTNLVYVYKIKDDVVEKTTWDKVKSLVKPNKNFSEIDSFVRGK